MAGFAGLQGLAQAAGVAQGLGQGAQSYVQTQNMLQEQAIKKKLANAQSADAYSKLLQSIDPERAQQLGKQFGLLPGGGLISPSSAAPSSGSDGSPEPINEDPSHYSPTGLAPSGADHLDDSAQPPTASGVFLKNLPWNMQKQAELSSYQEEQKLLAQRKEKQWEEQNLPKESAEAQHAQFAPTKEAYDATKSARDDMSTEASSYIRLKKALETGGEHAGSVAVQAFQRMNNPDIKRMLGGELGEEKGTLNKIENDIAEHQGKGISDNSAAAIERIADRVHGVMSENFRNQMKDMSDVYVPGGANPAFTRMHELDAADKLMNQGSVLGKRKVPQSEGMTTSAPAGILAKPGMSKEEFLNWHRNNAQ